MQVKELWKNPSITEIEVIGENWRAWLKRPISIKWIEDLEIRNHNYIGTWKVIAYV